MDQTQVFESRTHSEYVCKLKKTLYKLKQTLRAWYGKIVVFLVHSGYTMAISNSSLFIKDIGDKLAIVLVYVDDLILTEDFIKDIGDKLAIVLVYVDDLILTEDFIEEI
jgi:Reverse transcriptase (RNA-dependent DNA polymerase)